MSLRAFSSLVAAAFLTFTGVSAQAQEEPCGKFDFSQGLSCKIEVEGGCMAQCTPLSFKAGCTGGCNVAATQDCTDSCGEACILECNPALLDCFKGCHDECDQPVLEECQAKHPDADCQEQAQAQCDMHCEQSCEVPPSDCKEHCEQCCFGGCTTQVNFDCDFNCFAELKGGCEVQCSEPKGALFCNGQYVYASDIDACIQHLLAQGISVDASATASATCDANGCDLGAALDSGCAAAPGKTTGEAEGVMLLGVLGLGYAAARRRRRSVQPTR